MIAGALLAASATAAVILASRGRSVVGRRLALVAPSSRVPVRVREALVTAALERSGLGITAAELVRTKAVGALGGAAIGALLVLVVPLGMAAIAVLTYVGFVLPTMYVERAAAKQRAASERGVVRLVDWTEALVASGNPVESAFVAIASRGVGAPLVDRVLDDAARSYALGAPLFASLAHEATRAGLVPLADLAAELDRSRDLGRGVLIVLRDQRDRHRGRERARSLDAAGQVEGHLTLVLVLCYLPALMLLVVIPLFLGLLNGLFA